MEKRLLIYEKADAITFTNESMVTAFRDYYQTVSDYRILRFGLVNLELIDQLKETPKYLLLKKMQIPEGYFYITVGYNASPFQHHNKVLKVLNNLPDSIKNKFLILLPMTYAGSRDYISEVEQKAQEYHLHYKIFNQYLTDNEVANIRYITDVMIHVPVSDQFSGSMLETLYANKILITGQWLQYQKLDEEKAFLYKVNEFIEIYVLLKYIFENYDQLQSKTRNNLNIVRNLASWDSNAPKWFDLYMNILCK